MADTIEIELKETSDLIDSKKIKYWKTFPLLKELLKDEGNSGTQLLHIDVDIDTGTANTLTESTKPTNIVYNFDNPQQVYIRSDNALDVSKNVTWLGQKEDGSFGEFTFTTNATDGTTAVDCGKWNFIMTIQECDTLSGNLIIDDDGLSGTVFWTLALGVLDGKGIVVIPEEYQGGIVSAFSTLMDDPGSGNNTCLISIGDETTLYNRYAAMGGTVQGKRANPPDEKTRIPIKTAYLDGAAAKMHIHMFIAIWNS